MDIGMCKNTFCPLKDECYRFKCEPNPLFQWYAQFEFKDGNCDHFWEITTKQ